MSDDKLGLHRQLREDEWHHQDKNPRAAFLESTCIEIFNKYTGEKDAITLEELKDLLK